MNENYNLPGMTACPSGGRPTSGRISFKCEDGNVKDIHAVVFKDSDIGRLYEGVQLQDNYDVSSNKQSKGFFKGSCNLSIINKLFSFFLAL